MLTRIFCIALRTVLAFAGIVRATVLAISTPVLSLQLLQFGVRFYRLLVLYEYNIGNRRTRDIQNFSLNIVWFDRLLVLYEYSTGHWQD